MKLNTRKQTIQVLRFSNPFRSPADSHSFNRISPGLLRHEALLGKFKEKNYSHLPHLTHGRIMVCYQHAIRQTE
jgi:hypothetical protein